MVNYFRATTFARHKRNHIQHPLIKMEISLSTDFIFFKGTMLVVFSSVFLSYNLQIPTTAPLCELMADVIMSCTCLPKGHRGHGEILQHPQQVNQMMTVLQDES